MTKMRRFAAGYKSVPIDTLSDLIKEQTISNDSASLNLSGTEPLPLGRAPQSFDTMKFESFQGFW